MLVRWGAVFLVALSSCAPTPAPAPAPASSAPGDFRVELTRPVEELRREALAATPPQEPQEKDMANSDLVEVVKLDPSIRLDIRYATTNNFVGAKVYEEARAFLQRPAAEALVRAHRELMKLGYGVLIHDAYRPWYVTKIFWDGTPPDKHAFVANPAHGSRHNRGCAADVTLYDLRTGKVIEMPSRYDEMSERARADYAGGTAEQRRTRDVLRKAMEAQDFAVYDVEWWHFDYKDWKSYPVGNDTFEKLERGSARTRAGVGQDASREAGSAP
jgi:D-alanyl-D-alanine dipeptidase